MLLRGCKKLIPNLEIALDTLRADESIANAIHFTKEGDTTQSPLVNSVYKLLENDISQMEESLSQLSCAQKHYIQGITILSPRLQNMNVNAIRQIPRLEDIEKLKYDLKQTEDNLKNSYNEVCSRNKKIRKLEGLIANCSCSDPKEFRIPLMNS